MKNKWFLSIILVLVIFTLSGCNEMEEILGKVNKILDQQLEQGEPEEVAAEDTEETKGEKDGNSGKSTEATSSNITENKSVTDRSDGHENEADPMLSFEDRLQQAGYIMIDPPNGFPLTLPLDWVLVQVIKEEPWEGVFCFDTQLEETIMNTENNLREYGFDIVSDSIEDSDNVHSTKYRINNMNESWQGDMIYFIDEYGTACTKIYLEFIE